MINKEAQIAHDEALNTKAANTRLAAEYLYLMCTPEVMFEHPERAEHIHDISDESKEAIVTELTDAGAIEHVDGAWRPTERGFEINHRLVLAAIKRNH